ncbi:MAG: ABC transporter ATP-binding protein, partial [Mesorhizobium sp.]
SRHLLVLNNGRVLAAGEPESVIANQRVIEAYLGTRRAVA